jgi:restriction system protein
MADRGSTLRAGRLSSLTVIRAGGGGIFAEEFQSCNIVAVGWPEAGNLADALTREDIGSRLLAAFPYCRKMQLVSMLGQLYVFKCKIEINQSVLTYDPMERVYLIGTVTGQYAYRPDLISELPHTRPVKWINRISRDALSLEARNCLGSIRTVFSVSEEASREILRLARSVS